MVIAFPWSGRDWNRAVAVSGRAAMPGLPGGRGFDWRSMAGMTGALRPRAALSGLGAMARRRAGRGLGQDLSSDIPSFSDFTSGNTGYASSGYSIDSSGALVQSTTPLPSLTTPNLGPSASAISSAASQSGSTAPAWAGLLNSLVAVGGQITNYELNPLTNKSTYISTPQGGIIASNSPALAVSAPGVSAATGGLSPLSTATLSSMMPLLLLGGGLVLFMSMAKR